MSFLQRQTTTLTRVDVQVPGDVVKADVRHGRVDAVEADAEHAPREEAEGKVSGDHG